MTYTRYYPEWENALYSTRGELLRPSGTQLTAAALDHIEDGIVAASDTSAGGAVVDATPTVKGVVQLAGDLAGTATAPTVPALAGKASSTRLITAGTGLTGGGDLTGDRSLAVAYGSAAGTAAQGNDLRLPAVAGDAATFGDTWSNLRRTDATGAKAATNGVIWVMAGVAGVSFTARALRMFSFSTAGAGGNFTAGVWTGASEAALTQRGTIPTATTIPANSPYEWVLSSTFAVTAGQYVMVAVLATMTTAPTFQCLGNGGTPGAFLNPTTSQLSHTQSGTGQAALPAASFNLTTAGYTNSGTPFWVAIVP